MESQDLCGPRLATLGPPNNYLGVLFGMLASVSSASRAHGKPEPAEETGSKANTPPYPIDHFLIQEVEYEQALIHVGMACAEPIFSGGES